MLYRTKVPKKTVVLTAKLAVDFNSKVGCHLGDHIVLLDLIKDMMQMSGRVKRTHRPVRYRHEGELFANFLVSLNHKQSASLMRVIQITKKGLYLILEEPSFQKVTIGLLRNQDLEALTAIYQLDKTSAEFIQTAFARQ